MAKTFNDQQLKDIQKIIAFMDSVVRANNPQANLSDGYHNLFDSLKAIAIENGPGELAMDEEYKYNFLFNLDTSTFNAIWVDDNPRTVQTRDTIIHNPLNYHLLDINNQGIIMDYLKILSKKDKYFKSLYKGIEESGGLSPTLVGGMIYKHEYLNFSRLDDRFWAAVFYLTLEESIENKVDRYYKGK